MITHDQVVDLLATAAVYDYREAGPVDARAWLMAAQLAGWTHRPVERIIVEHYSRGAERKRITPAIIGDRLHDLRQRALDGFVPPHHPESLAPVDYPRWYRERLAEHTERELDVWAETGDEPRSLPVGPARIASVRALAAAAPEHLRDEIAATPVTRAMS